MFCVLSKVDLIKQVSFILLPSNQLGSSSSCSLWILQPHDPNLVRKSGVVWQIALRAANAWQDTGLKIQERPCSLQETLWCSSLDKWVPPDLLKYTDISGFPQWSECSLIGDFKKSCKSAFVLRYLGTDQQHLLLINIQGIAVVCAHKMVTDHQELKDVNFIEPRSHPHKEHCLGTAFPYDLTGSLQPGMLLKHLRKLLWL